jgi:hypothetical protein
MRYYREDISNSRRSILMSTLTVSAKRQVTLRKDLLKHLGVHPGEKNYRRQAPGWPDRDNGLAAEGQDFGCLRFFEAKERPIPVNRGNQRSRRTEPGRQAMKIAADTNVLVRAITGNDEREANWRGRNWQRRMRLRWRTGALRIGLGAVAGL